MIPKISLTWESFRKNVCNGFTKLQQQGEFVDMTLAADGHFVKVHRNLVSLASPYLRALIKSAPCKHPVVFLDGLKYATLCCILEYIYTGEVEVPRETLEDFMRASKALGLIGVQEIPTENLSLIYDIPLPNEEAKHENPQIQQANPEDQHLPKQVDEISVADSECVSNLDNIELQAFTPMHNNDMSMDNSFIQRMDTPQLNEILGISSADVNEKTDLFTEPLNQYENSLLENNIPVQDVGNIDNMDILQDFTTTNGQPSNSFSNDKILSIPEIQITASESGYQTTICNLPNLETTNTNELLLNMPLLEDNIEPNYDNPESPSILSNSQIDTEEIPVINDLATYIEKPKLNFGPDSKPESKLSVTENPDGSCYLVKRGTPSTIVLTRSNELIESCRKRPKTDNVVRITKCKKKRRIEGDIKIQNIDGDQSTIKIPEITGALQYTVSERGRKIQLIFNRNIFFLRTVHDDLYRWLCTDYNKRNKNRCPAILNTQNGVVVSRLKAHNHPFHDKRIAYKVAKNLVFAAIETLTHVTMAKLPTSEDNTDSDE